MPADKHVPRDDATTDIQPCENPGCWGGIIQANIQDFEGLSGG